MKSVLFILVLFFSINVFAQKAATLTGEIIDLKSYVVDKVRANSPTGIELTTEAFKEGGYFALLERKTNKIVILIPSAVNRHLYGVLQPYLGMQVFIKGKQYSSGGVRLLAVEDIGKSLK
jgi:hypothetical protein